MDYYIYVIHIALQIIPHNIHLLFLLDVEVLSLNILAPIIITHLIYILNLWDKIKIKLLF
jgi:hypothetical protein